MLIKLFKKNSTMRNFFIIGLMLISVSLVQATEPTTISTFQSISIYWSPAGGSRFAKVLVKFKKEGASSWREGLSMKYNPIDDTEEDISDYRGSIVNLEPNTSYEIELTLEGSSEKANLTAKTWSEDFPIGQTIVISDRINTLPIMISGTKDAYILIDGTGSTIDVDNAYDYCINVSASYVIIRGFTLKGARNDIIMLNNNCHDIVIENCDMSNWGTVDADGFGYNLQAGIQGHGESIERIVIQRNKIHNPRTDANSLSEPHNGKAHPAGPQTIVFVDNKGNHVIRYNEMWSDYDHMYNDIIGGGTNASFKGFPGPDSDIYGNYFSHCWDDGIESEGGNRNVRIWGNFIDSTFIAIGNAATSIGPLYIWRNIANYSYIPPGSPYGDDFNHGAWIKMGYSTSISWMTGHMYLFNNTILQPDGKGHGGVGVTSNDNRHVRRCVTRNNIFQSRRGVNSISCRSENVKNDFDFDLYNNGVPDGSESNGISGTPIYESGYGFDFSTMMAQFNLKSGTSGYDAGEVIPNFADSYEGSAPDMGAFEAGQNALEYGVKAYITVGIKEEKEEYPSSFMLSQNYPNPFNPTTTINYSLQETANVRLSVYDILGKEVVVLVNQEKRQGNYSLKFDASNLSSGLYFYKLRAGNFFNIKKMLLLK